MRNSDTPGDRCWWTSKTIKSSEMPQSWMCNCIGPQNGEPLCPCRMRNVRIKDGRYIEVIDHGPAPQEKD